jgi:lycopene beta-cyclase
LNNQKIYDIIIIGDGCASWLLLEALSGYKPFGNLQVLLLGAGETMSRTWCFWDSAPTSPYSEMIQKNWTTLGFTSNDFHAEQNLADTPYWYLPGDNFFSHFRENFLPRHPNITYIHSRVMDISGGPGHFKINTVSQTFTGKQVYNSAWSHLAPKVAVWQHFRGWFVEFDKEILDPKKMTLMDFNVPQDNGCSFMYILPFSPKTALVEWTFFSTEPQEPSFYENQLHEYIVKNYSDQYHVRAKEWGKIPMQQDIFAHHGPHGEVQIGTLGGMVKASTGYAFQRMLEDAKQLSALYFEASTLPRKQILPRFRFYDSLILWIIQYQPQHCKAIFTTLFKTQNIGKIVRFMGEKTSLLEEISIFIRLPKLVFLNALWRRYLMSRYD